MTPNNVRIMAVDDEASIRELLERGLARSGYRCVTASSAAQAAQLLNQEPFDLVLLDIMMPGKSGMELLFDITIQYPDTGVIMMTGMADTATAVKAMRDGALDYVTKPFNLDVLTARIEHALARRDLLLENKEYQGNLERMVAERTEQLEQRLREVTALNRLLQEHLRQDAHAQSQPLPDLEQAPLLDSEAGIPPPSASSQAN